MEKAYPREVKIFKADNGFLVIIGCQHYVIEGDTEKLTDDLKKYLELDTSVIDKYGYRGTMPFLNDLGEPEEVPLDTENKYSNRWSPVADYLYEHALPKIEIVVYRLHNGTVTLNYAAKSTIVAQVDKFPDTISFTHNISIT